MALTFQAETLGSAIPDDHVADLEAVQGRSVAARTRGVLALGCVKSGGGRQHCQHEGRGRMICA